MSEPKKMPCGAATWTPQNHDCVLCGLLARIAELEAELEHERRKCEALARQLEERTDCPAEMLGVDLDCERLCEDLNGEYHLCWLAWASDMAKKVQE